MSAHTIVKARTAAAHATIDAVYSRFDLGNQNSYIIFLQTHARVVPAIEAALADWADLPPWRPRTPLLMRDLDGFGYRLPKPLAASETSGLDEKFGLLYVLEGSRRGARLLLRRVGSGFPSHYLSATHEPGEWRAFVEALDDRAKAEDVTWLEGVVAGASLGFQLYASSASHIFMAP